MQTPSPFHFEFLELINEQLGSDSVSFFESLRQTAPISIRLNPKKNNQTQRSGSIPWAKYGRYLNERPVFTLDPSFHAGAYYVQEASSMFLEHAVRSTVSVQDKIIALDLCAAPGGKSTHLASLLNSESLLISNEVIRSRVHILNENIQKWGYPNTVITSNDPSDFSKLDSWFDLIVVDAPCSGEGLFRKDPESIGHWSLENVGLCVARQRRILQDVWPALKKDGVLVYSTCTYNSKEDEENMEWLAQETSAEFLRVPLPSQWGVKEIEHKKAIGYKFYPHKVNGEGFFLSVVRKTVTDASSQKAKSKFKFDKIGTEEVEQIKTWFTTQEFKFVKSKESILALPPMHVDLIEDLHDNLNVISAGMLAATNKHGKLVPEHRAALSIDLNHGNFATIDLTREEAIHYLRKDPLTVSQPKKGFALVRYDGNALGWVNLLGNRINNLYPANWRIRMAASS